MLAEDGRTRPFGTSEWLTKFKFGRISHLAVITLDFFIFCKAGTLFAMSLDPLYPFANQHAIQNALFVLEWKDRLTEKDIRDLKGRIQQRHSAFTVFKPQKVLMLNLTTGAADGAGPESSASESGFVFELPGGIMQPARRTLNVMPEQCQITINDYSRWSKVKADVDEYVQSVMAVAGANSNSIQAIGLQYTDVWLWKADPADLNMSEVFNRDSQLLVQNVFNLKSYWHSHHGYFESMKDLALPLRLNNINVSRTQHGELDAINVVTSHRLTFPRRYDKPAEIIALISAVQDEFHQENKRMLRQLLTPGVLEKIKLTETE